MWQKQEDLYPNKQAGGGVGDPIQTKKTKHACTLIITPGKPQSLNHSAHAWSGQELTALCCALWLSLELRSRSAVSAGRPSNSSQDSPDCLFTWFPYGVLEIGYTLPPPVFRCSLCQRMWFTKQPLIWYLLLQKVLIQYCSCCLMHPSDILSYIRWENPILESIKSHIGGSGVESWQGITPGFLFS